jgi:hypothetical protein
VKEPAKLPGSTHDARKAIRSDRKEHGRQSDDLGRVKSCRRSDPTEKRGEMQDKKTKLYLLADKEQAGGVSMCCSDAEGPRPPGDQIRRRGTQKQGQKIFVSRIIVNSLIRK